MKFTYFDEATEFTQQMIELLSRIRVPVERPYGENRFIVSEINKEAFLKWFGGKQEIKITHMPFHPMNMFSGIPVQICDNPVLREDEFGLVQDNLFAVINLKTGEGKLYNFNKITGPITDKHGPE